MDNSAPPGPHQHSRVTEALAAHDRGWWLVPIKNKRPFFKGWTQLPRQSREQVEKWVVVHELGVRTGHSIVVVDVDPGAPEEWTDLARLPHTPTVRTKRGGLHLYFAAPDPPIGNSAGRLAEHVDVRGVGGQAAIPGSKGYQWVEGREWAEPAPMPPEWLAKLAPVAKAPRKPQAEPKPKSDKWAAKALEAEARAVATAPEGSRNDALNTAAFNLGQIVAGGALSEPEVRAVLDAAAQTAGLEQKEIGPTINSGLRAGAKTPRTAPARKSEPQAVRVTEAPPTGRPKLLAPGSHEFPNGQVLRVSLADFADAALKLIPEGVLYRRANVVGIVHQGKFLPIKSTAIRLMVEAVADIELHSIKRDIPMVEYQSCHADRGELLLARALTHPNVRELHALASHPIATRQGKVLLNGWHAEYGILIEHPPLPPKGQGTPPWDLLSGFPLDGIGKAHILALLFTPIFRALLGGNAPLFVVSASQERVGKSKLVNDVVGGVLFGRGVTNDTWPKDDDEVRKVILAALLNGTELLMIDNVPKRLDSPPMASLVTSPRVGGRILGQSSYVDLANLLTVVVTGNQVRCSPEIAKRAVVIEVHAIDGEPELRADFKHDDLAQAALDARPGVLRWMVDMIEDWAEAGCPKPEWRLGGFERWVATVGGVLRDYPVLADRSLRVAEMLESDSDIGDLTEAWAKSMVDAWISPRTILDIAQSIDWGGERLDPQRSERARLTALGHMLGANIGRVIGQVRLTRRYVQGIREYRLAPL